MIATENALSQAPPGGRLSLPAELALIFGSTFSVMGVFGVGLIMPGLKLAFAGTPQAALVPWVATLVGPAFVLFAPISAFIIDGVGYRKVYIGSILLFVLAGVAPLFLDSLWAVLPFRVLLGAAVGGAAIASLDGIGRLPPDRRARLFGLQTVAGSLIAIIGFPIIGHLAKSGWHPPFAIYFFGLGILPLAFALPPRPSDISAAAAAQAPPPSGLLAGLGPVLLLLAATVGLIMFTGSVFSPTALSAIGVVDPQRAAISLSIAVVLTMISSAAYGWVHRGLGTGVTFLIGLAGIGLGFIVCGLATSLLIFTIGLLGYGAGIGLCAPNVFTWAVERTTASPGRATSLVNVAYYLTPICYPALIFTAGARHEPGRMFLLFGVVCLVWAVWFGLRAAPWRAATPQPAISAAAPRPRQARPPAAPPSGTR